MASLSFQKRAEEMNQSRETGVQSSFSGAVAFKITKSSARVPRLHSILRTKKFQLESQPLLNVLKTLGHS
jgi:hypothetical protein